MSTANRKEDAPTGATSSSLVGREHELGALARGLEDALAGRGSLFFLSGEPGIGKTRLAEEIAAHAEGRGLQILWGRAWEGEGAPAFWPWVQVIRAWSEGRSPDDLAAGLGRAAPYFASLVPELATRLPEVPAAPVSPDSDHARFYMFEATQDFLRSASQAEPLIIVLDDLHWADEPSLRLLQFLASRLRDSRLLVVATVRVAEVSETPALAELLGDIARHGHELPVGGLERDDVASLVERTVGGAPNPDLVVALHEATAGNPFFVEETVRLLGTDRTRAGGGERLPIPSGVRAVIRRQLELLPEDCVELLRGAAVVGREFALSLVAEASGESLSSLREFLVPAVRGGFVRIVDDTRVRYRFSHALVRETLYEDLDESGRADRHRRVGEALEAQPDAESHAARLAHHFFAVAAHGEAERAARYAQIAAERAMEAFAFEEAARLYDLARAARELSLQPADKRDCELLLARAKALTSAGSFAAGREVSRQAADLARALGEGRLLGQAAVRFCGTFVEVGDTEAKVRLLEEALAVVGEEHAALRAELLVWLGYQIDDGGWGGWAEERQRLVAEGIDLARRSGDRRTLAATMIHGMFSLFPLGKAREQSEFVREWIDLAREIGDQDAICHARLAFAWNALRRGDVDGWEKELRWLQQSSSSFAFQMALNSAAGLRAFLAGRFEEVEQLLAAEPPHPTSQRLRVAVTTLAVRFMDGRLADLLPHVRDFAEQGLVGARSVFPLIALDAGNEREARQEYGRLAADGFSHLQTTEDLGLQLVFLAEACARLGDAASASLLYERLLPCEGQNVVAPWHRGCFGAADQFLAALAGVRQEWELAERHFDNALEFHERMAAPALVAQTRHSFARMLLARDRSVDRDRAAALLDEAIAVAARVGMSGVLDRWRALRASIGEPTTADIVEPTPADILEPSSADMLASTSAVWPAPPPAPTPAPPPAPAPLCDSFVREGEVWAIRFDGETFRLKDSKGPGYLATLLARPGDEIHVLDLVGGVAEGRVGNVGAETTTQASLGDAGEMLDPQARAEYKRRLGELREELAEAEETSDVGRAEALRTQIEFLTKELSAALGLGGRSRRASSASERARVNVTRTIKDAIKRIAQQSPKCARYLSKTIRTGAFCSYVPDPDEPRSF